VTAKGIFDQVAEPHRDDTDPPRVPVHGAAGTRAEQDAEAASASAVEVTRPATQRGAGPGIPPRELRVEFRTADATQAVGA